MSKHGAKLPTPEKSAEQLKNHFLAVHQQGEKIREKLAEIVDRAKTQKSDEDSDPAMTETVEF
jgi:hypothetical protein